MPRRHNGKTGVAVARAKKIPCPNTKNILLVINARGYPLELSLSRTNPNSGTRKPERIYGILSGNQAKLEGNFEKIIRGARNAPHRRPRSPLIARIKPASYKPLRGIRERVETPVAQDAH